MPPDSRYIAGNSGSDGKFAFETDGDGNVLGGLRLPHMSTAIGGDSAGAPLGVYGGLDAEFLDPFNVFAWLGGTFEPFSTVEVSRRYPTNDTYVRLVERAARALRDDGLLLEEDYQAYVDAAKRRGG